jgi:hypothetical protein
MLEETERKSENISWPNRYKSKEVISHQVGVLKQLILSIGLFKGNH